MKRLDVISITGDLASGQSTVSKMLAEDLEFYLYRNGAYFRQLAVEKGMSVTEFGEYVKNHPEIDMQIEKSSTEYAMENENIVIEEDALDEIVINSNGGMRDAIGLLDHLLSVVDVDTLLWSRNATS